MKKQFTAQRRHGSSRFELVFGPETPTKVQRSYIKKLRGSKVNPTLAEVVTLNQVRRVQFKPTNPYPSLKLANPAKIKWVKVEQPKPVDPKEAQKAQARANLAKGRAKAAANRAAKKTAIQKRFSAPAAK
jgi:hypothetical protein